MTTPAPLTIAETDLDAIAGAEGRVAIVAGEDGALDPAGRRVDELTGGAVSRAVGAEGWAKGDAGSVTALDWPSGLAAKAVLVARLGAEAALADARKAGVAIGAKAGTDPVTILAGAHPRAADLALGAMLRAYDYTDQKTAKDDAPRKAAAGVTLVVDDAEAAREATASHAALAEGVFLTRDLVNAPANVLTTTRYAEILTELGAHGLEVEVMDEDRLAELGMGALLSVGQGSASPSKVVTMRWSGGGDAAPLALVGKGVVFDTGGISLKPAAGMEDMTMDMGGSAVVAGVMKTLAMRKAKANVVGLVGLVENMPGPNATRPGDVVTSMKGDTIEVINTDAEGRMVLCDVMWHAQKEYAPAAMIDLATLTGAIVIGLGHENAGVFSNDDALCGALLGAAEAADEGAWRMPLGKAYAEQLKSRIADVKNVGGRPAGSITAAEFLHRYVKDELPWCHIDIAGVAATKSDSRHAPKGASGWGVLTLDRLVRDRFEGGGGA